MTTDAQITDAMRRALSLAAATRDPSPNPRVGCVILDAAGEVVATGAHEGAGTPHAEVIALAVAGDRARGATAVVTLEPCAHTGRTGPCTTALIDAGVARVVYGQSDPNPEAAGGAAVLRSAGIAVTGGLLADEATALNPGWSIAMSRQRPTVTWKVAATLDGRVAAPDGSSRWITGVAAREQVHQMRAEHDAVLVGTTTVLTDDPELTARIDGARQPWRIVMGQRSVPARARVRLSEPADRFWQIPTRDPSFALSQMVRRDIHTVLLEGGPSLAGAFLRAGLIDHVVWYTAPAILTAGVGAVPDLGVTTLDRAWRLSLRDVSRVGDDVRIDLVPADGA
ncbi:MAG: bifunctional diaminohydroxyphosphoribosylaminopyrimidine deaminase/5-amino-6-(5-phosphoribosylamino)uracil reductase RibD [Candidatus Nanopelagicales bacterium]